MIEPVAVGGAEGAHCAVPHCVVGTRQQRAFVGRHRRSCPDMVAHFIAELPFVPSAIADEEAYIREFGIRNTLKS